MNKSRIAQFTSYQDHLAVKLKDPQFKAAYDALEEEFRLANELITARIKAKLTQAKLARKAGMKQAAIARLESGKANPSYKTLTRVAKALDKKIALV
jgi:DNA-binding XRE family transcriptional regulator